MVKIWNFKIQKLFIEPSRVVSFEIKAEIKENGGNI
jgi:hypothetical protein